MSTTRTRLRAAAVLTLALAGITTALPANAAPDVTLPNGCTLVGEPSPEHHTVCPGAVFGAGDIVWGTDLSYAELPGATFTPGIGLVRVSFASADLTDADLSGTHWMDVNASGVDALRANLSGVTFSGSLDLSWANFTSTVWTGATGLDTISGPWGATADQVMVGSSLAHADLAGVTLVLSPGVWFTNADLRGATFLVPEPVTWPTLFHDADLREARFEGWAGVGPSQFHRADLRGAVLDAGIGGAAFVDSDLRGAVIQPSAPSDVVGVTLVDSDLRGATLPAAATAVEDTDPWLYQWRLVDSDITGTSMAPRDVTVTTTGMEPAPATFEAGVAWDNPDDQDPFDADRDYWAGASMICDQDSGSSFPVGRTAVSCQIGFDHYIRYEPPILTMLPAAASTTADDDAAPWRTMFDRDWTGTGPYTFELAGTGTRDRATNPPPDADLAWFADQAGEPNEGWLADSVWSYAYQPSTYTYATDYVTTTSEPATFTVDVHTPPVLTATAADGVVGKPFDAAAAAAGWPTPTITVTGLPGGVTWTPDPHAEGLDTTGTFTGAPAPGQGGWHDLEVTATNTVGTDTTTVRVWVVEPAADLTHDGEPVFVGADLTVTGTGFTPTGQVQILDHRGALLDVIDADADGRVPATTYRAAEPGQVYFQLVDQTTTATARTPEVDVVAPATAPEPEPEPEPDQVDEDEPVDDDPVTDDEPDTEEIDELGTTGAAGIALTALAAALLTAIGTMAVLLTRGRRVDATVRTTTPSDEEQAR